MGEAPDKKCDRLLRTSSPEPHVSSSYPVPAAAVPVPAGMMVAVPLELVASPLKSGRDLGEAERSALVIGGTDRVRTGDCVVFCKVVAVTEAQVMRDGQVRAKGSPVHHATLGSLEGTAGPDAVSGTAERAPLGARFVKGKRERLLARAFMIRVIVLMTLMPDARVQDVIAALAGDLALVPWARLWRPASARAAGDWRNALGPVPLEELRDLVLGSAWREHQDRGCPGAVTIGKTRPLKAGSLDGTLLRGPDTPASRAFFGSVGTGDDSSPFPQARALPMTCCSCRALFAMPHGPAGTEKAAAGQGLLDEAMDRYPALFSPGWIWLMDRNYHGAPRIARMIRSTHVLIRLKSDIPLKRTSEILPDCSYRAELSGDGVTVPVRVIEYWVTVEGQEVPEMFCLVTDLMDWEEYPGPELAALYACRGHGRVRLRGRGRGPGRLRARPGLAGLGHGRSSWAGRSCAGPALSRVPQKSRMYFIRLTSCYADKREWPGSTPPDCRFGPSSFVIRVGGTCTWNRQSWWSAATAASCSSASTARGRTTASTRRPTSRSGRRCISWSTTTSSGWGCCTPPVPTSSRRWTSRPTGLRHRRAHSPRPRRGPTSWTRWT